ncbi:hypothetical protein BH18ACT15_BH18ACT15_05110 [soil metagenome]
MKIEGEYRLASGREEVWKALLDPQVLADTIPGCRRLESTGPDEYAMTVDIGVGAIKGAYRGSFRITDKQEPQSCKLSAQGRGAPGSVSVEADARLSDTDGGTLLSYHADAKVTGALAGVGQRMVAAAAKKTTAEFMSALDRALSTDGERRPQEAAEAGVPSATEPAEQGRVYTRAPGAEPGNRQFVMGLATGFAIAIAGVLVGRFTARR